MRIWDLNPLDDIFYIYFIFWFRSDCFCVLSLLLFSCVAYISAQRVCLSYTCQVHVRDDCHAVNAEKEMYVCLLLFLVLLAG